MRRVYAANNRFAHHTSARDYMSWGASHLHRESTAIANPVHCALTTCAANGCGLASFAAGCLPVRTLKNITFEQTHACSCVCRNALKNQTAPHHNTASTSLRTYVHHLTEPAMLTPHRPTTILACCVWRHFETKKTVENNGCLPTAHCPLPTTHCCPTTTHTRYYVRTNACTLAAVTNRVQCVNFILAMTHLLPAERFYWGGVPGVKVSPTYVKIGTAL